MEKIRMQWDTIILDTDISRKLWTFKNWVFTVKRDPSRHTMYKLNAYGFNAFAIETLSKVNPNALIKVIQKWTKIVLSIPVKDAMEQWVYLVFNWEKQLFIEKSKFTCNLD